jgi:Txe/YoeB family toxin of toxin-antitoxin system
LESGEIDINTENQYGDTVLIYALSINNKEMVELLLKQPNIDINLQEDTGYSPLMYVSMKGQKEMAELLLNHPNININEHNEKRSALTEAIIHGQEEIVKLLLKRGADVNIQYLDGYTALMSAVESGYAKIVELLLNQPDIDITIENDEGETALQCAERTYRISMARLIRAKMELLKQPVERNFAKEKSKCYSNRTEEENVEKFLTAVSDGDINEMDSLMEETNDNTNGGPIIFMNARNKDGDKALVIASKNGNLEVVKWLISYMKDNKYFKTLEGGMALITAAKEGHFDVVEELLNQKININSTDSFNRTALHYATENHHLRIVKLLIKKGAKVVTKDKYGKTALDIINEQIKKLDDAKNKKDNTLEYQQYESIKTTLEEGSNQSNLLSNDQKKDNTEIEINEFPLNKWEAIPTEKCKKQLKIWEKNEPTTYNKIHQLIEVIKVDPFRGMGRVEKLKADLEGLYSRKIDKNNRLIYEVDGEKVNLLSCKGHYEMEKRKK